MIIQENDFLKTYNDMSKLWEEAETDNSTGLSTTRQTEFSFEDIIEKAFKAAEKLPQKITKTSLRKEPEKQLTQDEIKYWCDLRYLLEHKSYSLGRKKSKYWYTRLLSFYKAHRAEQAILAALSSLTEFTSCKFTDEKLQDKLVPDSNSSKNVQPDITAVTATGQEQIECKAFNVSATVHNAKIVARHSYIDLPDEQSAETDKNLKIKICLVAHRDTLEKIYASEVTEDGQKKFNFPKYVKALDDSVSLNAALKELPIDCLESEVTVTSGLRAALLKIHEYLEQHEVAKTDRATYIINQHADALDNTIKKFGGKPPVTDDLEDSSVEDATKHLETSTRTLKQLAISLNKNSN